MHLPAFPALPHQNTRTHPTKEQQPMTAPHRRQMRNVRPGMDMKHRNRWCPVKHVSTSDGGRGMTTIWFDVPYGGTVTAGGSVPVLVREHADG